jgi:4-hydroxy-tetrahydrodipicolinate synthase
MLTDMELTGVYIPLITPFDSTGAVALDALESLAHEVLDAGARGIVALGTTGEPGALTPAEQKEIADLLRRICRERDAGLIVGAQQATPDEISLVLVPPFVRPGEAGVVAYFEDMAKSSGPIVIYHIPYRTGQRLSAATLRRLAAIANVVGIKLAAGGIDDSTMDFLGDVPPGFAVLGGDDVFLSPVLALGAHGGILASAHVATADYVGLVDAWHAGDIGRARALGHRLSRLSARLFAEPNPTVVKAVLSARGRIPTPRVRLPLVEASQNTTEDVLLML